MLPFSLLSNSGKPTVTSVEISCSVVTPCVVVVTVSCVVPSICPVSDISIDSSGVIKDFNIAIMIITITATTAIMIIVFLFDFCFTFLSTKDSTLLVESLVSLLLGFIPIAITYPSSDNYRSP